MLQEEALFHEVLTSTCIARNGEQSMCAVSYRDLSSQQQAAEGMARAAHQMMVSAEETYRREEQGATRSSSHLVALARRCSCFRIERDMWSLLGILTRADLLRELPQSKDSLLGLEAVSACLSVKEVFTAVYANNDQVRKGKILKDWVESAAADKVSMLPPGSNVPFKVTLSRLLRSKATDIRSMHPDAQISPSGVVVPYDTADNIEQEALLKCVWQLVRCGDIARAQEVAAEHNVFYLSASLLGVAYDCHVPADPVDSEDMLGEDERDERRIGNANRLQWMATCSKFATHLSKAPQNWVHPSEGKRVSSVAVLEMTIYAALSNNMHVLSKSPLLATWSDKLWSYLKCMHERDEALVMQRFHHMKNMHSRLFSPNSELSFSLEQKHLLEQNEYLKGVGVGDYEAMFDLLPKLSLERASHSTSAPAPTPSKASSLHPSETTEDLLLQLQCCVIAGPRSFAEYLSNIAVPLAAAAGTSTYLGRVYCHLVLWLLLSCPEQPQLADMVDSAAVDLAVGGYVDSLMANGHVGFVATYASLLDRSLRIGKYVRWLNGMGSRSIYEAQADSTFILSSAKRFFKEDVLEITRGTVESFKTGEGGEAITPTRAAAASPSGYPLVAYPAASRDRETALVVRAAEPATQRESEDVDLARMESLRWLCIDTEHRGEVVKQVNSFIVQFMLESLGSKHREIGLLLADFLPSDAVGIAAENLAAKHLKADELDRRAMDVFGEEYRMRTESRECETAEWEAEVGKLGLWRRVYDALVVVDKWEQSRADYMQARGMLLGDASVIRSSMAAMSVDLERSADAALAKIENSIHSDRVGEGGSEGGPFPHVSSVWRASELALVSRIECILAETCIANVEEAVCMGGGEQEYETLLSYMHVLARSESERVASVITKLSCALSALAESSIEREALVHRIGPLLKLLIEERRVFSLVAFLMARNYVTVCLETSSALVDVFIPRSKITCTVLDLSDDKASVDRVFRWLRAGVNFANTLADEEIALFKALDAKQLEAVLSIVQACVLLGLRLSPESTLVA